MKKEIIKTENLIKSFALESGTQTILNEINLSIYEGDFTVIMGASGSGKSTLLYALSGMDTATDGHIYFNEQDITKLNSDKMSLFRRDHCGFVFQQICLVNTLTVMNNVLAAGLLKKQNKKELFERAKTLLKSVEVEEHTWDKYPSQISGGRAQRVGIVRALINNPDVLFADEPTGSLNSKAGQEVLDLLTNFNNKGQTIIMVTHDVKSALRANRVLYLRDGKLLDEIELGKYDPEDSSRNDKLIEFLGKMKW